MAEAVHYAALVMGWSTQMTGLGLDPVGFAAEVDRTCGTWPERWDLADERGRQS